MKKSSRRLADCCCTREGECTHGDTLLLADESDEAVEPVMVAGSYLLADDGEASDQEVDDPQQVAGGFLLAYAPVDQTRTDDVTRGPHGSAGPNA